MVADELATRWRVGPLKSKFGGEVGSGEACGQRVAVFKPLGFMNASGPPTKRAAQFFQVAPKDVIVLHDELDLDFGRLRIKVGGGHGGHNGLRSLHEQLGPDYLRVRCGIGHPGSKERVVGHVLGPFAKVERSELPAFISQAADAVESILRDGAVTAMNRYNAQAGSSQTVR